MAENKKFTRLINSDGTKQAVALDMVSFDEQTKKLTLYSSVDNTIKEETTIPASEVDATLSQSGLAADAKATGDAVKDVVKVGGTASGFTGIIVGTGEEEIELVEQKDFDAEIAKLNAKVGTPLVANAASAMVDTTKIYVYTGNENGYVNGNWYFYNGTNWESGGVYNAVAVQTDKTLTQENKAADAKKTGDEFSSLKEDLLRFETIIPILAGRGKTWAEIKQNVKMGYGEILYPVGTEFEVECPSGAPYNSIIFVVVDHRVENDEHIMTMLMKHVIYGTEFDAIQAIICPEETMPAGTYHFALLSGYDTAYDGGKNVQFTLANDLEAGGQIVMSWPYNQTWIGENLTAYHAFGTSAIETCVMSEGTGGTNLGVADGTVSILNHTHRARYGSNNYKESAIRNWLDSDDAANAWQTQQTRFQRPCSYRTRAGFVTYLDPEFVAVIREGTHPNRTNEIFDLNGKKQAYSTTDKFYLASQEEISFSSESGIVCGTAFDFYNGAAQSDKIKYDITAQTTARYWWLRTPNPSYAYSERYVNSSGALYSGTAPNGHGAVAACEI